MADDGQPDDLEKTFFAGNSPRQWEKLRKKTEHEERREMLRRVVAIQDEAFLNRLIALDIGPERAMVLRLTPLIFVAWADGSVSPRERDAILRAASEQGVTAEKLARQVLGDWLTRKPDPRILDQWKEYIGRIWNRFTTDEQMQLRANLLGATREVANAAGGILGIGAISTAERQLLDELDQLLS
jgi:hypothetical protein